LKLWGINGSPNGWKIAHVVKIEVDVPSLKKIRGRGTTVRPSQTPNKRDSCLEGCRVFVEGLESH